MNSHDKNELLDEARRVLRAEGNAIEGLINRLQRHLTLNRRLIFGPCLEERSQTRRVEQPGFFHHVTTVDSGGFYDETLVRPIAHQIGRASCRERV